MRSYLDLLFIAPRKDDPPLKKWLFWIILFLIILISNSVSADGNNLLKQCIDAEYYLNTNQVRNPLNIGICFGLVQGVSNTMAILKSKRVCFPKEGIANEQAVRIVVKYLKDNPNRLHENEIALIMIALMHAYPCE